MTEPLPGFCGKRFLTTYLTITGLEYMETVETRVPKSSFSGIKGAEKERKLLEESSTSYLGKGRGGSATLPEYIRYGFKTGSALQRMPGLRP